MTCTEVIHPHGFRDQAGCTEAQDPDVVKGKLHMASSLTMYHAGKERRKLGWRGKEVDKKRKFLFHQRSQIEIWAKEIYSLTNFLLMIILRAHRFPKSQESLIKIFF